MIKTKFIRFYFILEKHENTKGCEKLKEFITSISNLDNRIKIFVTQKQLNKCSPAFFVKHPHSDWRQVLH